MNGEQLREIAWFVESINDLTSESEFGLHLFWDGEGEMYIDDKCGESLVKVFRNDDSQLEVSTL